MPEPTPTIEEQIQAIQDRYQPALDDLKRRAEQLKDDYEKPSVVGAAIGIDFEVEWKDRDVVFDAPSVTMRTKTLSLDVPEVFAQRHVIKFHTPSTRMEDRVVGRYPVWHGPFRMSWRDIIIKVPVVFMQEQRIEFDLPSVTMKRQEIKLDIPEVEMRKVTWKLKLPEFKVIRVKVETERLKAAGERLRLEGEAIAARMKSDIDAVIAGLKSVGTQGASDASNNVAALYDAAIAQLVRTIDELVARGIDPIKVPSEAGDINLRKQLADLVEQKAAALANLQQTAA